jgi:hypothetical protein
VTLLAGRIDGGDQVGDWSLAVSINTPPPIWRSVSFMGRCIESPLAVKKSAG